MMLGLLLALATSAPALAAPDGGTAPSVEDALSGPDRSAPPTVEPPQPLDLPTPQVYALRPGVRVHHLPVEGYRKFRVDILFRRGPLEIDGRDTAAFTAMAWLQDQRSRRFSDEELVRLQAVGDYDVWTDSGLQHSAAHLQVPRDRLDEGLEVLRDVAIAPRFSRSDLRLLRKNYLRLLLADGPTRAGVLTDAALTYAWFPKDHPRGDRPDVKGWYRLTRRQLRARHRALLAQAPVDVLVVADLPWSELEPRLRTLLDGVGVDAELPVPPALDPPAERRVIAIDLPGSTQATVAWRYAAPTLGHADVPAARLIDHALGGSFLSRLNAELREARGLVYGIESELVVRPELGHWTVRTEVRGDRLGETLDVVEQVVAGIVEDGVRPEEIDDGSARLIHAWNQTLAQVGTAAGAYSRAILYDRSEPALADAVGAVRSVAPMDTARVAERWLGSDRGRLLVVIGSRGQIEPQLAERGLDVVWVPADLMMIGGL